MENYRGKFMKDKRFFWSNLILLAFIAYFLSFGILFLIKKNSIAVDNLVAAFFCITFIFLNRRLKANPLVAFFAGLIFMPHAAGALGLYSSPLFNYHYDKFVHLTTAFLAVIVIMNAILNKKYNLNKFFIVSAIAFCIVITFGAFVEVIEYWGFRAFGFGEGYLGFGSGDNSKNFGPWEDSSLDNTFNIAGSLIGIMAYAGYILIKRHSGSVSK